jgi:alanine dehydrogenase
LRRLQNNLNQRIFTSTIQSKSLLKALRRCDVAIEHCGVERCPVVVTETYGEHMKGGAVIVDVSIDTGGCFETSEVTSRETNLIKSNVVHYCVLIFLRVIQNSFTPSVTSFLLLMQIAEDGGLESAIRCDVGQNTESIFTTES